ncbi:Tyrosine-protein kinase ptk [Acaryochloris thomasi RCC1774]|uniref:Tyrosine-protein kinase ptk n=1 Tax=Acaryochloris thomasi RCC1774 TaxID=1764569 RepID=A0A2W1JM90_9CYAN|nr:division plane positioning ATPase MipZ [Acaryochloris thomasi]PZD74480.1 Tyrosine-protein kinase ptk [Acaryochloris thomasi RCC1774]
METAAKTNEELFDADSQGDRPISSLLVVNPLNAQVEILSSDNLLQKVLERDPELEKISDVHKYRNFFDVDLIENSNVFSISAKGLTPEVVLQRAQIVTQTYQEHLSDLRSADVASRQAFYQADLKQASRDLSDAEHELARYRKAAGLVDTQRQAEAIISLISDLKKIQELALLEANRDASQSQVLSSRLNLLTQATIPVSESDSAEDTEYQLVLQELTVVTTELREKRTELTESHPYIKALRSKRDNLRQQLEQYKVQAFAQNTAAPLTGIGVEGQKEITEQITLLENSASSKRKQAQNIELRISLLEANLRSLPRQQSRLDTLKRRLNVSKRTFNELISQVERSRADALQSYPNVQLLNTPTLNPIPTSNRFWIAVHSLFAAGFGSLILLLILERRNPLLRPQDLAETSFPVATRIPKLQQSSSAAETLLPLSGGEAAFLKMAYGLLIQEIPNRCLMVTSAISGEGKTTIALHLAKALEALGLKVLVVHIDTSASVESETPPPPLESRFSHSVQRRGSSRCQIDETKPEGMQVGHLEFSGRSEFEAEVERIMDSQRYDFVILDTPPVQSGSTATLISMVVDNVLLVVRPGKSTRFSVQDTLQLLTPAHLNLVGLAINDPGYFGLSNRKGWEENFAISNANVAPIKVAA